MTPSVQLVTQASKTTAGAALIYVLSNSENTALHVGHVSCEKLFHLFQRIKHQPKTFDAPYSFEKLVYFEIFRESTAATRRYRELKILQRIPLRRLVIQTNASWENLQENLVKEMEKFRPV